MDAGQVTVDGAVVTRAAHPVADDAQVAVTGETCPFVSRGGLKLAAALAAFSISVDGKRALDVGTSTGGWTDCLLQRGAAHVLALDVGHEQMASSLRANPRVTVREGVNARFLTPADAGGPFDMVVADLSFISLTLVLPALTPLLAPGGDMILLVKPQFEVGAERLGRGGIVRSETDRQDVLARVVASAAGLGLTERGHMDCPIAGEHGNREWLLWLSVPNGV